MGLSTEMLYGYDVITSPVNINKLQNSKYTNDILHEIVDFRKENSTECYSRPRSSTLFAYNPVTSQQKNNNVENVGRPSELTHNKNSGFFNTRINDKNQCQITTDLQQKNENNIAEGIISDHPREYPAGKRWQELSEKVAQFAGK